jgi:hypothetical protein
LKLNNANHRHAFARLQAFAFAVNNTISGDVFNRLNHDLAGVVGRYVLSADIWPLLAKTPPGAGDEIQLTDAIDMRRLSPLQSTTP